MIVSNSSCLIILERLGKQDLLEKMFQRIVIPRAVSEEVFGGKELPPSPMPPAPKPFTGAAAMKVVLKFPS